MIWFAAFIVSGGLGFYFWGTWAAVPFFIVYGILYGSLDGQPLARVRSSHRLQDAMDERRGLSDRLFHDHARAGDLALEPYAPPHGTIIVGRDPEIITPRPPDVVSLLLNIFALKNTVVFFRKVFLHATGRLTEEEATFVPERERPKVFRTARIYLAIYAAVIAACLYFRSILPAMYIGLPTLYGGWFALYSGSRSILGSPEDVLDHRLNSRTVYMNPIFRFLYWNMNYHVEHHIFPTVPLSRAAQAA